MVVEEGANIWGLDISMRKVLAVAESIWASHGKELVITSGMDNIHSAKSLHYYGYAVDLRTRYFDDSVIPTIVKEMKAALGESYEVLFEKDHIHVGYRPAYGFTDGRG